jgi:hypothetical protein
MERVAERIRKLLALANNNPSEAGQLLRLSVRLPSWRNTT